MSLQVCSLGFFIGDSLKGCHEVGLLLSSRNSITPCLNQRSITTALVSVLVVMCEDSIVVPVELLHSLCGGVFS